MICVGDYVFHKGLLEKYLVKGLAKVGGVTYLMVGDDLMFSEDEVVKVCDDREDERGWFSD